MRSISQRLFLVNLIVVIVALAAWRIGFDLEPALQLRFGAAMAAVLAVVVLVQVYLAQTVTKPVRRLVAEIDRALAEGAPRAIEVKGHDELALLAARFNELQERIARRIRELEQFAGNVCHEIRTPLASIHAAAELAGDAPFASLIRSEAKRIEALTNTMLDYARALHAAPNLARAPVDPKALLEALAAEPAYVGRVVILDDRENGRRKPWQTDATLLTQALRPILDNALRFAPAGEAVELRLADEAIVVKNGGPWIPEVYLDRVFERFFSVPVAGGRAGTGIGLALARDFAEALGARLEAMNLAPRGVAFSLAFRAAGT